MSTQRIRDVFWTNAQIGFERERSCLTKQAYFWIGQDRPIAQTKQTNPLWKKARSLFFDARPLMDRLFLTKAADLSLAKEYWRLIQEHILVIEADRLWDEVVDEDDRACLVGALRVGYVIARLLCDSQANESIRVAADIHFRSLRAGQFTKEIHAHGGQLNEEYLVAGTEMMRLWLLLQEPTAAEELCRSRMLTVSKSLQKTHRFQFFKSILALTRLALRKEHEQVNAAEFELLELQLLWLKWLAVDPLMEIKISDLVISELLFQELAFGTNSSVEVALNAQQPAQVRKRYERLSATAHT